MQGLPNIGATCWLNALVQCMRVSREWNETSDGDTFTSEFLKLVRCDTDNTTHFLKELPIDPFGDGPSDSQEALMYILDRLERTINLKSFTGEVTQTVIYPGGRSTYKTQCTVWFHQENDDAITNYEDSSGKIHNVAVIQRELTKVPEVLVSDKIADTLFDKKLVGIVHWSFGHYVAYVRKDDEWYCANDSSISKATPILKGYIGFYN
jgi:ubiquitin C-terminal hydrolase